ncbi:MAG TPA: hypothetical protein PLC40_09435, partial [Candidatus Hydrogenedentes bacterium]|nr:hypothetical protein [Candidatus Hydrogenedentota bacterium]
MSGWVIKCPDDLNQETGTDLYRHVLDGWRPGIDNLMLDMNDTRSMDSLGGAWLLEIAGFLRKHGAELAWRGERQETADFMTMLSPALTSPPPRPASREGMLEHLGGLLISAGHEFRQFLDLSVDALYWTIIAPFEGRGLRFSA